MGDLELQIFSDRLKELRNEKGLTQAQFVDGLGITASALSAYEKNLKNPSISVAKRIAEKYNVSIDWLCGLSDKQNDTEKLETYADVLELLLKIDDALPLEIIKYDTKYGIIFHDRNNEVPFDKLQDIKRNNFQYMGIEELLSSLKNFRDKYYKGIIDDEIYQACIERLLRKSAYPISSKKEEETTSMSLIEEEKKESIDRRTAED